MSECTYCEHIEECKPITYPEECEDYEFCFERFWDSLDDIEREEYNEVFGEGE